MGDDADALALALDLDDGGLEALDDVLKFFFFDFDFNFFSFEVREVEVEKKNATFFLLSLSFSLPLIPPQHAPCSSPRPGTCTAACPSFARRTRSGARSLSAHKSSRQRPPLGFHPKPST